jgi:hypothetical protein
MISIFKIIQLLLVVNAASALLFIPDLTSIKPPQRDLILEMIKKSIIIKPVVQSAESPRDTLSTTVVFDSLTETTETTTVKAVEHVSGEPSSTTERPILSTTIAMTMSRLPVVTNAAVTLSANVSSPPASVKPNVLSYEEFVSANNRTYYILKTVFRLVSLRVGNSSSLSIAALNKSLLFLEELVKKAFFFSNRNSSS